MYEQTDGTYDNPFKFNAKELDDDTGLYYYGARYYNPRLSIWYGVDPLAVYNPVMETEFYGDGQHNGGVYFWGNLNPYIYTYQNPIKYIDPNGKQSLTWALEGSRGIEVLGTGGAASGIPGAVVAGGIIVLYKTNQLQKRMAAYENYQFSRLSHEQQKEKLLQESFPVAEKEGILARDFPAAIQQKITVLNADHSNNDKKKVGNAEVGDIVQTPDSNGANFNKRRDGTYENRNTGEIWDKSHTQHSGGEEWKVGIGKKPPSKNNKITVSRKEREVLKINKSK